MVMLELQKAAPKSGTSPQRFLKWLSDVNFLAPKAVAVELAAEG